MRSFEATRALDALTNGRADPSRSIILCAAPDLFPREHDVPVCDCYITSMERSHGCSVAALMGSAVPEECLISRALVDL